ALREIVQMAKHSENGSAREMLWSDIEGALADLEKKAERFAKAACAWRRSLLGRASREAGANLGGTNNEKFLRSLNGNALDCIHGIGRNERYPKAGEATAGLGAGDERSVEHA